MFAGVGERTREGNDLYKEMIESVRAACLKTTHLASGICSAACLQHASAHRRQLLICMTGLHACSVACTWCTERPAAVRRQLALTCCIGCTVLGMQQAGARRPASCMHADRTSSPVLSCARRA